MVLHCCCEAATLAVRVSAQGGNTALHYAAQQGHLKVVQWLVTTVGCDPRTQNQVCDARRLCIGARGLIVVTSRCCARALHSCGVRAANLRFS